MNHPSLSIGLYERRADGSIELMCVSQDEEIVHTVVEMLIERMTIPLMIHERGGDGGRPTL